MEIKDLQQYSLRNEKTKIKHNNITQPSLFKKSLSSMVDILFVTSIRITVGVLITAAVYFLKLQYILKNINLKSPTLKMDLIQIGFHYYCAIILLSIFFVGSFYYVYCWSYKRSATFGNTLFSMKVVNKNTLDGISILTSILRYILYILPVLFAIIVAIQYLYQSLNIVSFILMFLIVIWYDIGMLIRLKAGWSKEDLSQEPNPGLLD